MPDFQPMLASSGQIPGREEEWAFEPKLDGWRAMVRLEAGRLAVLTRSGRNVAEAVPELAPLVEFAAGHTIVLDGELVAHAGDPSSFYRVGPRLAARRSSARSLRTPIAFVAFDCLWLDGDFTSAAYVARRAALESLQFVGPAWCTIASFPGAGAELFAACTAHNLEGVVAKRLDASYTSGVRSPHWVKAKCRAWLAYHAPHRHRR